MEKVRYMISDAAALAGVETHVLRDWEEELDLTIPRNEMGHRYYTRENIQEFQRIKELKENGYQLKAIRTMLHQEKEAVSQNKNAKTPQADHGVSSNPAHKNAGQKTDTSEKAQITEPTTVNRPTANRQAEPGGDRQMAVARMQTAPVSKPQAQLAYINELSAEERMMQFRELMSDIVGHAIAQNNEALTLDIGQEIKETVLKEMNYLFREQADADEERYKQLNAAIRGKLKKKHGFFSKKQKPEKAGKEKALSTV